MLQEAMRVRPVAATGVTRYTKRAMKLGGCYLPAGTMIAVPFYAVDLLLGRVLSLVLLCWMTGHSNTLPMMWAFRFTAAACTATHVELIAPACAGASQPQQLGRSRCVHPGKLSLVIQSADLVMWDLCIRSALTL